MRTIAPIAVGVPYSSPATIQPRSPWQSPVPYLFGGMAAMLSLIAFALLILACSYWRLSTRRDLESGAGKDGSSGKASRVYEEKILVIMAGHDKPTFLATPVCSRISAFGHVNGSKTEETDKSEKLKNDHTEMAEDAEDHHEQNP